MDVAELGAGASGVLVSLVLAGPHADAITRFVEARGWQPTDGGPLHPDVRLTDVEAADRGVDDGTPVVLLVGPGVRGVAGARAAAVSGARSVLDWPDERERLPEIVAPFRARERPGPPRLTVGGAAGGVGTTTIALTVAGLSAWRGARVLALTHGSVPAACGPAVDGDALAGPGTWSAATPVAGIGRLRVLRVRGPVAGGPVHAGPADLVVCDLGVTTDADVLVVRRDRAGLSALEDTTAGTVVCTDLGVASARGIVRLAGGRRLVVLDWSVRVARAALRRRIPAGLPGAWVRRLAGVAPSPDEVVPRRGRGAPAPPPGDP